MKNRVCELLNIDYPVIQGGMAWVATANLRLLFQMQAAWV